MEQVTDPNTGAPIITNPDPDKVVEVAGGQGATSNESAPTVGVDSVQSVPFQFGE